MLYMVTFTINIPQMLAYIPYTDPYGDKGLDISIFNRYIIYKMGHGFQFAMSVYWRVSLWFDFLGSRHSIILGVSRRKNGSCDDRDPRLIG